MKIHRCIGLMAIAILGLFTAAYARASPVLTNPTWYDFQINQLGAAPNFLIIGKFETDGAVPNSGFTQIFDLVGKITIGAGATHDITLAPFGTGGTDDLITGVSPYVDSFGVMMRYLDVAGPVDVLFSNDIDAGLQVAWGSHAQKVAFAFFVGDPPPYVPPSGDPGGHVPEPATFALVPLALAGVMVTRRRNKQGSGHGKLAC
jgi:hypothetical protein